MYVKHICGQVKLNSKCFKIYLVLRLTNIKGEKENLTEVKLEDILFTEDEEHNSGGAECTADPITDNWC